MKPWSAVQRLNGSWEIYYYKFDTNEGFSITKIIDLGGSRTYISGQVDRVVFNLPLEKLDQHIDHLLKFREIL